MQMNIVTKATRLARTIAIGALALGAATMAMPSTAEASSQARAVSQRLDQIANHVDNLRDVESRNHQIRVIDALQKRLYRLDRINDDQRGRLARVNDARIDRLQARLHRIERQTAYRDNRRDYRRDDRRSDNRNDRRDYRRDDRRSDNREERWNSEWSRQSHSK